MRTTALQPWTSVRKGRTVHGVTYPRVRFSTSSDTPAGTEKINRALLRIKTRYCIARLTPRYEYFKEQSRHRHARIPCGTRSRSYADAVVHKAVNDTA